MQGGIDGCGTKQRRRKENTECVPSPVGERPAWTVVIQGGSGPLRRRFKFMCLAGIIHIKWLLKAMTQATESIKSEEDHSLLGAGGQRSGSIAVFVNDDDCYIRQAFRNKGEYDYGREQGCAARFSKSSESRPALDSRNRMKILTVLFDER